LQLRWMMLPFPPSPSSFLICHAIGLQLPLSPSKLTIRKSRGWKNCFILCSFLVLLWDVTHSVLGILSFLNIVVLKLRLHLCTTLWRCMGRWGNVPCVRTLVIGQFHAPLPLRLRKWAAVSVS
jgi:hypothetical protein